MSELGKALVSAWQIGPEARQWHAGELKQGLPNVPLWLHLDRAAAGVTLWLREVAHIPDAAVAALLDEDTRPRLESYREGALLILRGVNPQGDNGHHEMVALRIWITPNLMITLRKRTLASVGGVRALYEQGRGPQQMGELLVTLVDKLNQPMDMVTDAIEAVLNNHEVANKTQDARKSMALVARQRSKLVLLRRYIHPQQAALNRLLAAPPEWLSERDRALLRNAVDDVSRQVEDIAALTEHATIVHDQLSHRLAERLNRNMYVLSIVAGIFLPLSFLTGLLGVNVGGIPGASDHLAFAILCGMLLAIGLFEVWLFRRVHLL